MSLEVEDGTGKANAEAYGSVAGFRTYWLARGHDFTDTSDSAIEAALRNAFTFGDTIGRYKGTKLVAAQAGEFPRAGLVDWSGNAVTGLPNKLVAAHYELARKALTEELYQDLERGGMIAAESVGPISVSYLAGAPPGKMYRAAMQLLQQYFRDKNQSFGPVIGGVANSDTLTPIFNVGMHSNRGE